jgi:hypothetical protein
MRASLTVAGIEVALSAPRGPLEAVVADRYDPFLGAVGEPVCSVRLEAGGERPGTPNPPMARLALAGSEVRVDHPDFTAEVDLAGDGVLRTLPDPYVVDHFFRLLVSLLAPAHDALMLHACGAIAGGRAHVFAGPSGSGKSTLAGLAGHRPVLSDEHVVVRRLAGRWVAASTPFWGSYARPGPARQAPLARLWSLRHWPTHEVRPLDAFCTLRLVLENAVLAGPQAELKLAAFPVAADLAAAVPAAELRFTPTESVWDEIDDRAVA